MDNQPTPREPRDPGAGREALDLRCPSCGSNNYAVTLMGWLPNTPEADPNWIRCGCGFRGKMTCGELYQIAKLEAAAGLKPRVALVLEMESLRAEVGRLKAPVAPPPSPEGAELRGKILDILHGFTIAADEAPDVSTVRAMQENAVDGILALLPSPQASNQITDTDKMVPQAAPETGGAK